jgi:hypothetical protein
VSRETRVEFLMGGPLLMVAACRINVIEIMCIAKEDLHQTPFRSGTAASCLGRYQIKSVVNGSILRQSNNRLMFLRRLPTGMSP